MTNLYPLKLSPVSKSAIWGGTRLKSEWHKPSDLDTVAETWELTVREKENNLVQNGPFFGKKLADALHFWGNSAIGAHYADDRFPLLVKFIDAADRLSVQVHPNDDFAASVGDLGKTEAWYIVDADEGATILWGLADGVDEQAFARAIEGGDPESVLQHIEVKKGDIYFIPAGMPHAIGKGILIAEIQQNCDLTYRVYDYNRRDKNGNLRELHIDKALQVTRPFTPSEVDAIQFFHRPRTKDTLVSCPYFSVRRVKVVGNRNERVSEESFASLLFLSGEGFVEARGHRVAFTKGDSFFLPAGLGEYRISGTGEILISTL